MIELDDYVSIRFFCIVVTYKATFYDVTALYVRIILILKNAMNHLLLDIISRSVLALHYGRTLLNLFLDQIFIPLVLRGHDCYIVLFITLTQVIREWHVFGRFIKRYPGSIDMLWVILQCNIPASLPMINSIICAAYSCVLVIPNPNINFVENIILFITTTITLSVNT